VLPDSSRSIVDKGRTLAGIGFGLGAYGIWGFFPLFFRQLGHVSPADVLCNRALWAAWWSP
jgi:chloramphenicol-sensitive protein RarD